MKIDLDVQYSDVDERGLPHAAQFHEWAVCALEEAGVEDTGSELGIVVRVVGTSEMLSLNHQFRNKAKVTNVLSFPFEAIAGIDYEHLGDIVICAQVVEDESKDQGKEIVAHWAHLLIHGILHLLGLDHIEDEEAKEMEALERRIMGVLNYRDPYESPGLTHAIQR